MNKKKTIGILSILQGNMYSFSFFNFRPRRNRLRHYPTGAIKHNSQAAFF